MDLSTPGIVCAVLRHGEHGAVVRLLTPDHGLLAGYVRGGGSRRLRPVLQAGNGVLARLVARVDTQLAAATVELVRPRSTIAATRLGSAGLEWLTALTATALTEREPHPRLYDALDGLLEAMMLGAAPGQWLAGLVRYELLLLGQLGFGLDLSAPARRPGATADLGVRVTEVVAGGEPRSGSAVCGQAADAAGVSGGGGLPHPLLFRSLLPLPTSGEGAGGWESDPKHRRHSISERPTPNPSPEGEGSNKEGLASSKQASGTNRTSSPTPHASPTNPTLLAGLTLTGHFLARDVLTGSRRRAARSPRPSRRNR